MKYLTMLVLLLSLLNIEVFAENNVTIQKRKSNQKEPAWMKEYLSILVIYKNGRRQYVLDMERATTAKEVALAIDKLGVVMENFSKSMNRMNENYPEIKNSSKAKKLLLDSTVRVLTKQVRATYDKFSNTTIVRKAKENMMKRQIEFEKGNE